MLGVKKKATMAVRARKARAEQEREWRLLG